MWVLILVLYLAGTPTDRHTRLLAYTTLEECTSEGERIAVELMEAYPGDRDTWLVCRLEHV